MSLRPVALPLFSQVTSLTAYKMGLWPMVGSFHLGTVLTSRSDKVDK